MAEFQHIESTASSAREWLCIIDAAQRDEAVGSWTWDPATGNATCSPEQFGLAAVQGNLLSLNSAELRKIVHSDDYGRAMESFTAAARQAEDYETEFRVLWPDGSLHWLVAKGRVTEDPITRARRLVGAAFDITAIRRPDETLRQSELRFRHAFYEAAVGMVILDVEGRIQSVNRGFADITLYSPGELTGRQLLTLIAKEHHTDVARDRRLLLSGAVRNYRAERRFIRQDGVLVWVRCSVSLLQLRGERHTIALVEDITEQKQARERLNSLAMHDPLTGLPNRRHFEQDLDAAIRDARESLHDGAREVALLYVDLDGFKLVNDTLGHTCGDLLLAEVAERIRASVRDSARLARVGGDEFTIVLRAIDGVRAPTRVAAEVLQCFNTPFQIKGNEISIGASVGISRFPLDGGDSSSLMQSADAAMYHAKRSGNNRYQFFTAQMRQDAHTRLRIGSRLRRALDNNEISVQFQPQYELAGGRLVRFEALCRWYTQELGQVPPDRFIPIAEETGLIVEIGNFVLREACTQALAWQVGPSPVQIAVNVSAVQFARADFVSTVIEILRETGLNPTLLELELTESTFMRDREDGIRKMQVLKKLGVHLSIDDFGTGYSSLSYLENMPIDALKIDRSFTAKLGSSQTALSMVRAIIAMARALDLRIVTEGVENPGQVAMLRQLGCDEVQGYHFGRPEDAQMSVDRVLRSAIPALTP